MSHVFLVMDFVPIDIKKLMTVNSTDYEQNISLAYNMLCAINFIHSTGIIHRDIKPANILVDKNSHVRICDFGLSTVAQTHFLSSNENKSEKKPTIDSSGSILAA